MPKITLYHPDGEASKFELNKRLVSIGRGPDNDIVLPDGSSSSNHAVLKMNADGDFEVTDLGSTNQTKVNGTKVTTAELLDGDELFFGDTRVTYHSDLSTGAGGTSRKELSGEKTKKQGAKKVSSPASFSAAEKAASGAAKVKKKDPEATGAGGCFAILMLPLLLSGCLLLGMSIRHYTSTDGEILPKEWFALMKSAKKDAAEPEP